MQPLPPPGGPGWSPPPPYATPPVQQGASTQAVTALVLAILSWVGCGCLLSIPAIFVARAELVAIDRGQSAMAGRGLAQAAFWVAVGNLIVYVLILALYAVLVAMGVVAGVLSH